MPRVPEALGDPPYLPTAGVADEAIAPDGAVLPHAAAALRALEVRGLADAAGAVTAAIERAGASFHAVDGDQAFVVDAVPRVIAADEWALLEAGLAQRARALDLFVDDVYGARSVVSEGVVPERVIETTDHLDPRAEALRPPSGVWIGVCGLDIVRDADGAFRVLEDNVRTPSGIAYAMAARAAVSGALDVDAADAPRPVDEAPALLLATLRAAAPSTAGPDPHVVLLSDGPDNSAWWEHRALARSMGVALVTAADLEIRGLRLWLREDRRRPVDAVYRRTDAAGSGSEAGDLLGEPLGAGTLGVVNAFGAGVADDKLVHAYVEELIRFHLGEEPLLRSVRTFDPCRPEHLAEICERLAELVVKPRNGSGGVGVVICPHADEQTVEELRRGVREHPERYVAQELVMLSTHPTVADGALHPRHVDLRPFVFLGRGRSAAVLPGGLTRFALEEGALVVNSSQNGGAKDTWVMA